MGGRRLRFGHVGRFIRGPTFIFSFSPPRFVFWLQGRVASNPITSDVVELVGSSRDDETSSLVASAEVHRPPAGRIQSPESTEYSWLDT